MDSEMSRKEKHAEGKAEDDLHPWVKEFPGAVVACDKEGIIVDLNDEAAAMFAESGGRKLIGSVIYDCHPGPCKAKLTELMDSRRKNIYTIRKDGRRELIFQTPWYRDGQYAGYCELILELPQEMPHFDRDKD
ncbi:MAG: diguanylate cyclase [Candidatus Aminicenantes bacterium]|nr:diguanylate cyclase [Candidatus Aminicenantes bacterium]